MISASADLFTVYDLLVQSVKCDVTEWNRAKMSTESQPPPSRDSKLVIFSIHAKMMIQDILHKMILRFFRYHHLIQRFDFTALYKFLL